MPDHFGDRLRRTRSLRGFTMEELGRKVGVAKTTISGYENGNREPPIKVIHHLAKALNTTSDYLLGLSDTPVQPLLSMKQDSKPAVRYLHWDGNVLTEDDLEPVIKLLETIVHERSQHSKKTVM